MISNRILDIMVSHLEVDVKDFCLNRSLRITVNKSLKDVGERDGGSKWIRQTWRLQELNLRLS